MLISELRSRNIELHDQMRSEISKLHEKVTTIQVDIAFWKGKQAGAAAVAGAVAVGVIEVIKQLSK